MQTLFQKNKPEYTFFMTSLASQKPFPCTMPPEQLKQIYAAALAAADPYQAVLNAVRLEGGQLQLDGVSYALADYQRIVVVGAGKATARRGLKRFVFQLIRRLKLMKKNPALLQF